MPQGNAIYWLRTEHLGESQQAFGRRFGLGQSSISDAENGVPSRDLALAIFDRYGRALGARGFSLLDLLTGRRRRWRARQGSDAAEASSLQGDPA